MIIPGKKTDTRQRIIPGSASVPFRSYTDGVQPRDQLDRALIKVATNTDGAIDAHIVRLYRAIQARGEEVFYIKRRLEGDKCWCYDEETRSSGRAKCADCFGTGIVDGYMRYFSARNVAHGGKIWIAAPMSAEEVELQNYGLQLNQSYSYWTLPMPVEDMAEGDFLKVQAAIYQWNGILKKVFKVEDVFILFMNHHEPDEKHVYWHLLPIHKEEKPDFRYNYTWFGERAKEVNGRPRQYNRAIAYEARIALKRYSNE